VVKMNNLQDTINWINERLTYISVNCDMTVFENERAYKSLKTALNCANKVKNENNK